ncbi:Nitrobenzene nitroreductase [compost metagenome]
MYQQRRRDCALQLYESVGIAAGDRVASQQQTMRNFSLFDAPHVAIITSDRALGTYGAVDCGGYVANLLLAAEALGLGAIAQAALARHSAFVRRHFGIDDSRLVVCGVSFGYADHDAPANRFYTTRAATEDTVLWHDS